MQYDIVIRNGMVVDGSGLARYRADIGIAAGRIVTIGKIRDSAREIIDADGHVVAPGFIDGHTHMDAQVFWDALGTCSCWHGVTSVVMGNCGFSLAPCPEKDKSLVIRNLERAEDISGAAMNAGVKWSWNTFSEYLDAVDRLPKGINYAAYVGHSALRTFVMGERAFTDEASPGDMDAMKRELRDAIRAGAAGLSTSRSPSHNTPQGQPVASRLATWDEVKQLVGVMGDLHSGVFEIAREQHLGEPDKQADFIQRMKTLAIESGVPATFGVISRRKYPNSWRPYLQMADEAAAAGGRMFIQTRSKWGGVILTFESNTPFDKLPVWRDIRNLPLAEQEAALRNPEMRRKLKEAATEQERQPDRAVGAEPRAANYDWIFLYDRVKPPYRSIAEIAKERSQDPFDTFIDLALEKHLKQFFFQPTNNEDEASVLEIMKHPRSIVTFSDSGAHVSQTIGSSVFTYLLDYWVHDKEAMTLEEAVRRSTFDTAAYWGLTGRGLLREGWAADIAIFDPDKVGPQLPTVDHDLPSGARRLKEKSQGLLATIVNGQVLMRNNEHTGALPGQLLRGSAHE